MNLLECKYQGNITPLYHVYGYLLHYPGVIDGCQQQKGFEAAQVAGPRLRSPRHRPPPPPLMSDCQGESAAAGATSEHLTSVRSSHGKMLP